MKNFNVLVLSIALIITLTGCGSGGGGEKNESSNKESLSIPAGMSQAQELKKQYRVKAKDLIEQQEHYEYLYEMMSTKERLASAKRFREGKKQLNSLQRQIEALKNAEKISFLSPEEVKHRYKNRLQEVLIVENETGLIETHSQLINLMPEGLEEIEDKKVQRVNFKKLTANQKLKVYETSAFIYIRKI